jgi:hypothetical protein
MFSSSYLDAETVHPLKHAICHRPRIDLGQGLHDLTAGALASKGIKLTTPIWI